MHEFNAPPNDSRAFVHKRIGRAIGGFVTSGPLGAVSGFVQPTRSRARRRPTAAEARASNISFRQSEIAAGRNVSGQTAALALLGINVSNIGPVGQSFAPRAGCPPLMKRDPISGECRFFVGEQVGPEPDGRGGGQAVSGRYGAGLVPDVESRTVLECLPGMVLGDDNVCYNRRDIKNAERKWPKGRAPLLTGGERNAITKASRAARKITNTTKALQKMGMLAKPKSRARAPKQIGPGGPAHHHHS